MARLRRPHPVKILVVVIIAVLAAMNAPVGAQTTSAPMSIGLMRCEYAVNPVGIDTRTPRLGW
ncbi:MAG: hypothetical protein EBZ78_07365, partial [Verrucomicrobia bacterium]|nr:hypothetical protein [Verrucomicrobiota bacterium]